MCGAEPAFPCRSCHRLRSRHTSVTVRPCPNPSQVDMSPQQPLERRWERFRSAIPKSPIYGWSSTTTSGQRRRTSAAGPGEADRLSARIGPQTQREQVGETEGSLDV